MEWFRNMNEIKKATKWWWNVTKLERVLNENRGYKQLTKEESFELNDNRLMSSGISPVKKRASTARPVVIVETEPAMLSWIKFNNNNCTAGPEVNLNDRYIEVYYTTDSEFSYPGKLERYKKNVCYCCDDCPACQIERKNSAHRPLQQVPRRRKERISR